MKCENCPYYWADTQEYLGSDGELHVCEIGRKYCHYRYNDGYAPCEVVDEPTYDYDEYSEDYE